MAVKTKPNRDALKLIVTEVAAYMHTTGKEVEQMAKRSMRDGGTPHVPSSPGEPPRIDTKNLHESIMTETEAGTNGCGNTDRYECPIWAIFGVGYV